MGSGQDAPRLSAEARFLLATVIGERSDRIICYEIAGRANAWFNAPLAWLAPCGGLCIWAGDSLLLSILVVDRESYNFWGHPAIDWVRSLIPHKLLWGPAGVLDASTLYPASLHIQFPGIHGSPVTRFRCLARQTAGEADLPFLGFGEIIITLKLRSFSCA